MNFIFVQNQLEKASNLSFVKKKKMLRVFVISFILVTIVSSLPVKNAKNEVANSLLEPLANAISLNTTTLKEELKEQNAVPKNMTIEVTTYKPAITTTASSKIIIEQHRKYFLICESELKSSISYSLYILI